MSKIITVPDPILRKISKPIVSMDKKSLTVINDLDSTLNAKDGPRGVGLSAVQIAVPVRVFATFLPSSGNPDDTTQQPQTKIFINPKIIKTSKAMTLGKNKKKPILEGCLSIPGIWGPVWRYSWIDLEWQTELGKIKQQRFQAFYGRVIQHEYDHLNGILFTDHSMKNNLPLYESKGEKLEKIKLT